MGILNDSTKSFRVLHDSKADERWAGRSVLKLVRSGLADDVIRRRMSQAWNEVSLADAPAEEVLGPSDEWARGVVEEESLDGAAFRDENPMALVALASGLVLAAFMALISAGMDLASHGWRTDWRLGFAMFPPVAGVGVALGLLLRERLLRHHTALWVNTALVLAATALVAVPASLFGVSLGHGPTLWWLAEVVLLLGASWVASRHARAERHLSGHVNDERWTEQVMASLRDRGDLSEAKVQERVAEVREHAHEAGSSLSQEFGNPRAFVGSLPVDRRVTTLRAAIFWTALCALDGLLAMRGSRGDHWMTFSFGALLISAVGQWLVYLRPRRAR